MKRLIFLTPISPIYAEANNQYSMIRFYGATLGILANQYKASKIIIGSCRFTTQDAKIDYNWKNDFNKFYEINSFNNFYQNQYGINLEFKFTDEINTTEEDLVVFGILNNPSTQYVKYVQISYKPIIENSKGYIYLNSDFELTNTSWISTRNPNSEFMQMYLNDEVDQIFKLKLLGILNTESPYVGYQEELRSLFKVPVEYLPMIAADFQMKIPQSDICNTWLSSNDIRFLRSFDRWIDYKEIFKFCRDNKIEVHFYESSLPAQRKKFKPYMDELGIIYETARNWSFKKGISLLQKYTLVSGMSIPTNHRLTYKIAEACLAGRLCIHPSLCIEEMDEEHRLICNNFKDYLAVTNDIRKNSKEDIINSFITQLDKYSKFTLEEYKEELKKQNAFYTTYCGFDSPCNIHQVNNILKSFKIINGD